MTTPDPQPLADEPQERQTTAHERVWCGPIFAVDADHVRLGPGQEPMARQVVAHHDAVAVVALRQGPDSSQDDGAAELLVVRQYRHPVRAALWEIPAGLLDVDGEDPLTAAARELAEEAELQAGAYERLATFLTSPGCSTERLYVYMATELSEAAPDFVREDEEAEIVSQWFPLADVLAAVDRGDLGSPTLVVGVLAAARRLGVGSVA